MKPIHTLKHLLLSKLFKAHCMMVLCGFFAFANAANCVNLKVVTENKNILLNGPEEKHQIKVFVIKNISSQSIWLDHPVDRPSASAGWSSYLRAGNGAVLSLNRKKFSLSCSAIHPGKVEVLDCAKVITLCSATEVENVKRKSTYWWIEDKPWDELVKLLTKKGLVISPDEE